MADPFQDIYTTAGQCRDLFVRCLSRKMVVSEEIINHQRRFMSWASYLGVFAPVSASLDTRLRDAPEVKKLVILLLNVLIRSLKRVLRWAPSTSDTQGHATEQVDSKPDGALYGMVGAIDRLHRLAAIIRNPQRNEDVDKVLKYSQKQGSDGFDSLIVQIMNFRWPNAPDSLRMQLARSIIYRRDRLRYQQNHWSKLATVRVSSVEPASLPLPTPVVSSDLPKDAPAILQTSVPRRVAAKSETEPTVFNITAYLQDQQQQEKPSSIAKSSGSSDRVGDIVYPKPPAVPERSFHTECQFCYREVSKADIDKPEWWRSHVNADLQPYVCISDNCGSFPPSFSRRRAWFTHMKEHHGSDWAQTIHCDFEYRCVFEHDPKVAFRTEGDLFQHLSSAHSRDLLESDVSTIITQSRVPILSQQEQCVICKEDVRSLPTATSSRSTAKSEVEPKRGTLEFPRDQDSGKLKEEKEPPIAFSGKSNKPTAIRASKATVSFAPSAGNHEPDSTTTPAAAKPRSDESIGREGLGSIQVKMHNHLADHLQSFSFLSLRWWDEDANSGSQDSGEVRVRVHADSNSSQDLGESETDSAPLTDPKSLSNCLKSLAFPEMYNQINMVAPPEDKTCQWLFFHEMWNSWATSDSGLLFIEGRLGSGKSTLLRYVLQHISEAPKIQTEAIVLSFFFNRHGTELQKTALGLFRSLLYQLLSESPNNNGDFVQIFQDIRNEHGEPGVKWHWSSRELVSFFKATLPSIVGSRPIWLFVDAVDECEDATELVQTFHSLLQIPLAIHICITYRPVFWIDSDSEFKIRVEEENREDISTYTRLRVSKRYFSSLDGLIVSRSNGVFLWAIIVVEYARMLKQHGLSPRMIMELPQDLEDLYLACIPNATRPASLKLIRWICLATRALSLRELRWAMIVENDSQHGSLHQCEAATNFPADEAEISRMIRDLSSGLITTVQAFHTSHDKVAPTKVAQFIHSSIRGVFIRKGFPDLALKGTESVVDLANFIVEMPQIHLSQIQLSRTCIRYLAMDEIGSSASRDSAKLMSDFPLLHYATKFWVTHAIHGQSEMPYDDGILHCLGWPSEFIVDRWVRIYNILDESAPDCPSAGTNTIHVVSRYNLPSLLRSILQITVPDTNYFDKKDIHGRTPLWWAAEHGNKAIVELLLSTHKVNINMEDNDGETPLSRASKHRHDGIAQLLQDAYPTNNT